MAGKRSPTSRQQEVSYGMVKGRSTAQASGAIARQPGPQSARRPDRPSARSATRRVRLVFLIRSLAIGGAERQLVELAKRLDPGVFDVTVLCLYPGGEFTQDLIDSGIRVISLNKGGRWDLFGFSVRLATTIWKLRPDILHPYMTISNITSVLLKPVLHGSRIVWGIECAYFDRSQSDWFGRMTYRLEGLLSRLPQLVIFNSYAGRDYHLSAGFSPTRTAVIHNGIDTQRFLPDEEAGSRFRARWRLEKGTFVIGTIGRLDPFKDHPTFLRAAATFAKTRPDAKFVCIGDGPIDYASHLRCIAQKLGLGSKVIWAGSVIEDMPGAYNALNICTSSSYSEGTSNAIAEAMACGVPCVVTDVGDSSLIVGETGILVPAKNPEALAAGWDEMARRISMNPRVRDAARERIKSELSLSALVSSTSTALLNLL